MIRIIAALMALIATGAVLPASAQGTYPDRQIRYLLHVAPGGATDVMARKLALGLEKEFKQTVVVENKPGGNGATQMVELTGAKPDGYTIGAVTSSHVGAFNQTLKRYSIDSVDWIVGLVEEPYLFVVHKDSPFKSMKDLAEAIKAKPGFVVAGFTRGGGSHFAWEIYAQAAGIPRRNVNWVPYDSVAAGVTAVLGKHGETTVAYLDLVKDHVTAGNLRVIGTMTAKRMEALPAVATLEEQGFKVDTTWQQFRGVIGPKGMPDAVKQRIAEAVRKVLAEPEMVSYIKDASLVVNTMGPADFTAYAKAQDATTKTWMQQLEMVK